MALLTLWEADDEPWDLYDFREAEELGLVVEVPRDPDAEDGTDYWFGLTDLGYKVIAQRRRGGEPDA